MIDVLVTAGVRATVDILDAGEIRVEPADVRDTVTILGDELAVELEDGGGSVAIQDADEIAVELSAAPAASIAFQDGPVAVVEIFDATFGLRGPPGADGTAGTPMQPTYRLRPAGGWNEATDTYENALPSEPLEPTEVVLIHSGVGARFHVDPPDADPVGIEFQLSGPQNRTVRFGGYRPREGDQVHVEPYLRTS